MTSDRAGGSQISGCIFHEMAGLAWGRPHVSLQNNFASIPTPNTLDSNTAYQEQHQGGDCHQVEDDQQGDEEPLYPASAAFIASAGGPIL